MLNNCLLACHVCVMRMGICECFSVCVCVTHSCLLSWRPCICSDRASFVMRGDKVRLIPVSGLILLMLLIAWYQFAWPSDNVMKSHVSVGIGEPYVKWTLIMWSTSDLRTIHWNWTKNYLNLCKGNTYSPGYQSC